LLPTKLVVAVRVDQTEGCDGSGADGNEHRAEAGGDYSVCGLQTCLSDVRAIELHLGPANCPSCVKCERQSDICPIKLGT
jgi:hypothetical protein